MSSIQELREKIILTSAITAVSINCLLIILICFKSPKSLGAYKYLMVYIAAFEMAYALLSVAEKPEIYTKKSAFFILVDMEKSVFPKFSAPFFDLLFVGFYGMTISLLAIHFIYRYLAIMSSNLLETFHNWKIFFWMSFPILNGAIWTSSGIVVFMPTEDSNRFMRNNYNSNRSFENLYYAGPFFYPPDENGVEYVNWSHFAGSAVTMSLIMLSFGTMAYFGIKSYIGMKDLVNLSNVSDHYRSIQAQLFYALVFQTMIPVLLMHIPASTIYVVIFFDCATEIVGNILTITIALYPAVNPLPTIFIVKSYRRAIIELLLRMRYFVLCKPIPSSIHSHSTVITTDMTTRFDA